jgi:hypothetical protein
MQGQVLCRNAEEIYEDREEDESEAAKLQTSV